MGFLLCVLSGYQRASPSFWAWPSSTWTMPSSSSYQPASGGQLVDVIIKYGLCYMPVLYNNNPFHLPCCIEYFSVSWRYTVVIILTFGPFIMAQMAQNWVDGDPNLSYIMQILRRNVMCMWYLYKIQIEMHEWILLPGLFLPAGQVRNKWSPWVFENSMDCLTRLEKLKKSQMSYHYKVYICCMYSTLLLWKLRIPQSSSKQMISNSSSNTLCNWLPIWCTITNDIRKINGIYRFLYC